MNAALVELGTYQCIFASLNDAVYAVDGDGRIQFANAAMERLSGYAVRELLGRSSIELYMPADRPVFLERRARALQGEAVPPLLEATLVRRGDQQVSVELSMANLMMDGQIAGRIAVVRDLTDRMRREAELRETLARLQAVFAFTTAVIYIMDAEDRFLLINRRFEQLFKVTNAAVAGQPVEAVFTPEIAAVFRANNRAVREAGTPLEFEEVAPHDDGLHTYLSIKVPLYGADGALDAICGISTDITERRRAEAALARALRQKTEMLTLLRTLVTAAPVGIAFLDRAMRYRLLNAELAAMNGLSVEAHLGRPVGEVVPALLPSVEPIFRRVLDSGEPVVEWELTGETAKAPGEQRTWRESWYPVLSPGGQVLGVGVIVQEITEHKRAEAALQAALQAKEVLLKEVHHRIKNNLQVVSSLLDMQADGLADADARAAFEDSQRRIQAMALVHESLYRAADLAHVNAADYVRELCTRLFEASRPPGDRIVLTLELEAVSLEMDTAIPCGLILNELLSNALKHAFPAGRAGEITVALCRTTDGPVQIRVRDTGVGVPEHLDLRTTPSLGWQLVGLLTEQLRGTLALDRRGGTTVTITLPLGGRD